MDCLHKLNQLGYDAFFDNCRLELNATKEHIFRVTAEHKGVYEVIGESGEFRASVTGRRMSTANKRDDFPAVGDWVVVNDTSGAKVITDILTRKTSLHKRYGGKEESQLIATNIDIVYIVESIDRDYNLNRFERYLVLAREGGIKPVIILNKSDLSSQDNVIKNIKEINERFSDVEAIAISTMNDSSLQKLTKQIKAGNTYCFVGSSGVGKSSIINKLLSEEIIQTGQIGDKTGRGRHTTRSRQMYFTENGGIIIDNPGSREVGVANSKSGTEEVFSDIETISNSCKFANCKHNEEPGCAIQAALKSNIIDASRYENYLKIKKEANHYQLSEYEKRLKNKKIGKYIKRVKSDINKFKSE